MQATGPFVCSGHRLHAKRTNRAWRRRRQYSRRCLVAVASFIGYGKGAIAVIDPASRIKVADIALQAHPEGFQIDPASGRLYANVPDARAA